MIVLANILFLGAIVAGTWNLALLANGNPLQWSVALTGLALLAAGWLLVWLSGGPS